MIKIQNISKKFGNKVVLDTINFELYPNEIVGLIGPNGSGKTTLLNILMGILTPSSGTIYFPNNIQINAAVSRKGFFDGMTVRRNLELYASLNNYLNTEVERVMNLFDIDFSDIRFGKLSAGMKQRVALAKAFIGNSNFILLDEPTNHLDIDSIINLRVSIEERKKLGTRFLVASHILTELEKLSDRVIFIKGGVIQNAYSVVEIREKYSSLEDAYLINAR